MSKVIKYFETLLGVYDGALCEVGQYKDFQFSFDKINYKGRATCIAVNADEDRFTKPCLYNDQYSPLKYTFMLTGYPSLMTYNQAKSYDFFMGNRVFKSYIVKSRRFNDMPLRFFHLPTEDEAVYLPHDGKTYWLDNGKACKDGEIKSYQSNGSINVAFIFSINAYTFEYVSIANMRHPLTIKGNKYLNKYMTMNGSYEFDIDFTVRKSVTSQLQKFANANFEILGDTLVSIKEVAINDKIQRQVTPIQKVKPGRYVLKFLKSAESNIAKVYLYHRDKNGKLIQVEKNISPSSKYEDFLNDLNKISGYIDVNNNTLFNLSNRQIQIQSQGITYANKSNSNDNLFPFDEIIKNGRTYLTFHFGADSITKDCVNIVNQSIEVENGGQTDTYALSISVEPTNDDQLKFIGEYLNTYTKVKTYSEYKIVVTIDSNDNEIKNERVEIFGRNSVLEPFVFLKNLDSKALIGLKTNHIDNKNQSVKSDIYYPSEVAIYHYPNTSDEIQPMILLEDMECVYALSNDFQIRYPARYIPYILRYGRVKEGYLVYESSVFGNLNILCIGSSVGGKMYNDERSIACTFSLTNIIDSDDGAFCTFTANQAAEFAGSITSSTVEQVLDTLKYSIGTDEFVSDSTLDLPVRSEVEAVYFDDRMIGSNYVFRDKASYGSVSVDGYIYDYIINKTYIAPMFTI